MHLLNMPEIKKLSIPERFFLLKIYGRALPQTHLLCRCLKATEVNCLRSFAIFDNHRGDLISFEKNLNQR